MAQPADDLTRAQELAAQLKDEIHHSSVLLETVTFVCNQHVSEVLKSRVRLLLDMDVLPSLVHIIKSRENLECREIALELLDIFLLAADDQLPEIVDVNLVKILIAKLQERDFAFYAASALATIARKSHDLRQMISRNGFMDAVLVAAGNCKSTDDFFDFTTLVTFMIDPTAIYKLPSAFQRTKKDFFLVTLLGVHLMFKDKEFEDSPESLQTVLPLVQYILEKSHRDLPRVAYVCSVLIDFFRHPMPAKTRQLWRLNLAPLVVTLIDSRNRLTASEAITCVAFLAGSGPLLTDQLLSSGVVHKLAVAARNTHNPEGVCVALRELVRHGGSSVMSSLEDCTLQWLEGNLLSTDRKLRLVACTTLVCMMHAEDALPGRFQVTLGSLVGKLWKFLASPLSPSGVELVLTHLAVALDTAEKHPDTIMQFFIDWENVYMEEMLKKYTCTGKLYTSERARVLLERLRNLKRLAQ